jgi:hypothetical protein
LLAVDDEIEIRLADHPEESKIPDTRNRAHDIHELVALLLQTWRSLPLTLIASSPFTPLAAASMLSEMAAGNSNARRETPALAAVPRQAVIQSFLKRLLFVRNSPPWGTS